MEEAEGELFQNNKETQNLILDEDRIDAIKEAFNFLTKLTPSDNNIGKDRPTEPLRYLNEKNLKGFYELLDINNITSVEIEQVLELQANRELSGFMKKMKERREKEDDKFVEELFHEILDSDNDGYISQEELKAFLTMIDEPVDDQECTSMIDIVLEQKGRQVREDDEDDEAGSLNLIDLEAFKTLVGLEGKLC